METWVKILKANNRYEVSNFGRVRKCNETIIRSNGRKQKINSKILTPIKNKYGYLKVRCSIDLGIVKNIYIHSLVAEYFVKGRKKNLQVNHKDGNKINNRSSNLEWVTTEENIRHAWNNGLSNNNHFKIKVLVDDIIFESINKAAEYIGVNRNTIAKSLKDGYYTKRNIPVIFNGVKYNSLREASKIIGLNPKTIQKRGCVMPKKTYKLSLIDTKNI